jgi:hypothetical protein
MDEAGAIDLYQLHLFVSVIQLPQVSYFARRCSTHDPTLAAMVRKEEGQRHGTDMAELG